MKKKSGKALIISGAIMLLTGILFNIRTIFGLIGLLTADESADIGIIGGADAPTAIFLTDRIFADMMIIEKAGLLLLIAAPILIVVGIAKCIKSKHPS